MKKLHLVVKNKFKEAELRCDLIPEDLNIYDEVLGRWSTRDLEEIEYLISIMSQYHSALASEIGQLVNLVISDTDFILLKYYF